MTKWEYQNVGVLTENLGTPKGIAVLDRQGSKGWEVCAAISGAMWTQVLFKRQVEPVLRYGTPSIADVIVRMRAYRDAVHPAVVIAECAFAAIELWADELDKLK